MLTNLLRYSLISTLFVSPISFGDEIEMKVLKGLVNANKVISYGGSSLYTWVLVAGLSILACAVTSWFVTSKSNDGNVPPRTNQIILIGIVCGCALTFVGGALGGAGELIGISNPTDRVDYRNLDNQLNR